MFRAAILINKEQCIYVFPCENLNTNLGVLGACERITLIWKQGVKLWTRFIWIWITCEGRLWEHGNKHSGLTKKGICWQRAKVLE
jgi:hypothetical protein